MRRENLIYALSATCRSPRRCGTAGARATSGGTRRSRRRRGPRRRRRRRRTRWRFGRQETRRGVARPAVVERLRGGVARAAPRQRPGARRVAGEGLLCLVDDRRRAGRGPHERRERLEAAAARSSRRTRRRVLAARSQATARNAHASSSARNASQVDASPS